MQSGSYFLTIMLKLVRMTETISYDVGKVLISSMIECYKFMLR
jgi:hypothetical protein